MAPLVYTHRTLEAARLLGSLIRQERLERRWTTAELADRGGVTRQTVAKVERGDPSVKLGTAFDLAALVGIPLFDEPASRLSTQLRRSEDRLRLLPKRARPAPDEDDDDF